MRGNIVVKQGDRSIWLYTRKLGMVLPEILQRALIRGKGSWGDTATLTHIIYSEMLLSHIKEDKGFGISTFMQDNGSFIWAIDDKRELVGAFYETGGMYKHWTFDQFCQLEELSVAHLTDNYGYEGSGQEVTAPTFPQGIEPMME